jgi:tRNA-dihydrouridine synthase
VIRDSGVDAVILHPRFAREKFRRHARHDLLPWAAGELRLPMIVSGDLTGPQDAETRRDALACAAGLMIGRMAAAQPWVFAQWQGRRPAIDHAAVWMRFFDYVVEDFVPNRQLARVKMFTEYFSRNFQFGHTLFTAVQTALSMAEARDRAAAFFASAPPLVSRPGVLGIS